MSPKNDHPPVPEKEMSENERLAQEELARECAEEIENFRKRQSSDSKACFELFRQAICDNNQIAWKMIRKQYGPPVMEWWVTPRLGFIGGRGAEEREQKIMEFIFDRAIAKFWGALTPEKFKSFRNIKPLLAYLKMCVNSVIVDQSRLAKRHNQELSLDEWEDKLKDPGLDPENLAIDEEKREEFWDKINKDLKDEERLVIDSCFVLALKPGEAFDQFREKFNNVNIFDVDEVYKIRQNVITRLRRQLRQDPEFQKLLG